MSNLPSMERVADVSSCGTFRYSLGRRWGDSWRGPLWIMLNPSTADANVDDPTIRRCIGFSGAWGYSALHVVNLYAYRATRPADLADARARGIDTFGPRNAEAIRGRMAVSQGPIVAAWGNHGRGDRVVDISREFGLDIYCLGRTATRQPRHPLYVRGDAELAPYSVLGRVVG